MQMMFSVFIFLLQKCGLFLDCLFMRACACVRAWKCL